MELVSLGTASGPVFHWVPVDQWWTSVSLGRALPVERGGQQQQLDREEQASSLSVPAERSKQ